MNPNPPSQNGFVGGYVNDMVAVLTAAMIGRQNAVIIGAPGWGKTRIALSFAHQVVGKDATSVTRLHPAAPPDVFMGAYDPIAFTQGKLSRVTAGTPYDPDCKFALIDEFSRANEAAFDAMLDVADRLDVDDAPPVVATANFPPTGERTKALLDRFALWFWVNPGNVDAAALSSARLQSYSGGRPDPRVNVSHVPTQAQLQEIWSASPGPHAAAAVSSFVGELEAEASKNGLVVNPRRNAQWTDMLFRLGMWYAGMDNDFSAVPDAAAKMLIYAWPAQDANEAASWAQIALSVVDTVAAAIDAATAQVMVAMENIIKAKDHSQKGLAIMDAVKVQTSAEQTIKSLCDPNDPRVMVALDRMRGWLSNASSGKPLE
jgi:MoxR-like ATPase